LLLLITGEGIDDAVNRLGCASGMQRAEHQVAGFCRGDGGVDRFKIAHFTHQHDVGILAQGAAQRLGEVRHVYANFALSNEGLLCACDSTRSGLR